MIKNRGGLNPALKPGPVVPPGTQKTPDQAARNSQSAVFGHLSDILAFLRGGRFLTLFLIIFCVLNFITFSWFWFSVFWHFLTFSDFPVFPLLMIYDFWSFFVIFYCWVDFWSLFVSKLGAWFMTHFCPREPALPLSPILVVKFDLILWH